MTQQSRFLPVESPADIAREQFTDPEAAVTRLQALYDQASEFLLHHFTRCLGAKSHARVSAPFTPKSG